MRASKEEKAASRERIVAVAAERIREAGTEQPGVAEIMQAAGLTHGGFYKHFASRDELITEAVRRAMVDSEPRIAALAQDAGDDGDLLSAFLGAYLSAEHRDDRGSGCGVAALGSDMPRLDAASRDAFSEQIERYRDRLQALLGDDDAARRRASLTLSAMVGGLVIARALGPTPESDDLLRDVREALQR